jgi:poly(A) polymerase
VTPAGKLPLQPWMTASATRAVVAALTARGAPARFVGGCVRDALLGRAVKDIDIATADPPPAVIDLLTAAGIKAIPTGIDHGTVTAVAESRPFEITTLRRDVETMGRKARVAFTDDWAADAARRDFTLNAIYCDADGTLYDPTGGIPDLRAGRVRFVGDAGQRIEEDYLRILRFFRIYAHYGRPPADAAALRACSEHAKGLAILSAERVAHELLRLLAAPDPAPVLQRMRETDVLDQVLPEAIDLERLRALARADAADPAPVRRLAAVLGANAATARRVAARLKLAHRDRDRLVAAAASALAANPDPEAMRTALYAGGAEGFADQVYLRWAEAGGRPEDVRFVRLLETARAWQRPEFPLRGDDVLKLGVERGPRVGELLGAVERWWVEGGFTAGREKCLARLRSLAGK